MFNALWAAPDLDAAYRTAAVKLGYSDFLDLTPREKLQVCVFFGGEREGGEGGCVCAWGF